MIEKYTKYASFLSIVFFLGAVWYDVLYYQSFGIDIFTYISFSETMGMFIGNIPLLLFTSIFIIIFFRVLSFLLRSHINKLLNYHISDIKTKKQIFKENWAIASFLMSVFFIVLLLPSIFYSNRKFLTSEGFFFLKTISTLSIVFYLLLSLYTSKRFRGHINAIYLLIFGVSFFLSIYFYANSQLWDIRNNPEKRDSLKIYMKSGKEICTNESLIYIGKTSDYIFLYNNTNNLNTIGTIILKVENIDSLKIFRTVSWYKPF